MRKLAISLILLASQTLPAWAGGTSEAFLKIGVGARPIGMGNAFTAVANDINAIAWNPAGLSQLAKRELGAMHAELFADTRYDFIGYAHPLILGKEGFNYGTLGFGFQYLTQGKIESRDANRQVTGGFSGSDLALNLAFSRALSPATRLGVNLKYLSSSIEAESAQSFALDLGGMYRFGSTGLQLGMAAQNLGPGVKFINETNPLPLTFAVGTGYQFRSGFLLAMDVKNRPHDNKTFVSFGTEYAVLPVVSLRAGYLSALAGGVSASGAATGRFGEVSGIGAGFGLKLFSYNLDYAFTPFGELGSVHRISLGGQF